MFSNYNVMKLENNSWKVFGKITNVWKLNHILLNNQLMKEDIRKEIIKYSEINENKYHAKRLHIHYPRKLVFSKKITLKYVSEQVSLSVSLFFFFFCKICIYFERETENA